jgi:hypothetical protein
MVSILTFKQSRSDGENAGGENLRSAKLLVARERDPPAMLAQRPTCPSKP